MKKIKICFAASSGGHFEQLMMLKPLMKKYDSFIVTEKTKYSVNMSNSYPAYYLLQVNRNELSFIFKMIYNTIVSLIITIKERPSIVVCTGVLSMIPMCIFVKLIGGKLIYIESFAKITSPTKSGKLLYHFADRFYVQWKTMLRIYPNAIFLGGIY